MRPHLFLALLLFPFLGLARPAMLVEAQAPQGQGLGPQKLGQLWSDLADLDAAKAYRAFWALTRTPAQTINYVAEKLAPTSIPDPGQLQRWLEALNSDTFAVREKANAELTKLGGLVEAALKKALGANPSLETRRRLEKLLNRLRGPISVPAHLREVRVVEVLEHLGTDAANALLAKYAAGAPGSRLTRDSREALGRSQKAESGLKLPLLVSGAPAVDLYGDPLPAGAVGRLGTTRFRHNDRGSVLTFLPDGKRLITSNADRILVWEFPSGRLLHEFSIHPLYVRGCSISPDGKQLAVAGYSSSVGNIAAVGEIRVLAFPSGEILRSWPQTVTDDLSTAFSADGKLVFSLSSPEGVLWIGDIASGKEVGLRKLPPSDKLSLVVTSGLAVSKDGAYVAAASERNSHLLWLWKWRDQESRRLSIPAERVAFISFSPDGKLLAAAEHFGSMFVLEVASGRVLWQHDSDDPDLLVVVGQPEFAPDGKTLAVPMRARLSIVQYQIQLVDSASGRVQASLATALPIGDGGWRLAYSLNGRTLAAHCGCGVRFWDVATRREITPISDAHQSYVSSIVVSSKGFVVTASDDGSVRAWDAVTTKQRWQFVAKHWVRAIAVSPVGTLVAASSLDDVVHVLDGGSGREIYRLAGHGRHGGYRTLGFFPDSRGLASFGDDYYLRVWDMKTGKARLEHAVRPKGMKFPGEGDTPNGAKKSLAPATLTADARTLVLGHGRFHFFDIGTGKELANEDRAEGRRGGSGYFAMSPDGKYLLASEYGDFRAGKHPLSLIDVKSGTEVLRLLLDGSSPGRVAFAADGRAFATIVDGPRSEIIIYETASGTVRGTIAGFRGQARALAFFPDGRRLASAQSDSSVLIWDLAVAARKGP